MLLFERLGWDDDDYATWSREQAVSGRVLCVPTRWQDRPVLRLIFVNPSTDPAQVAGILDSLD